MEQKEYAWSFHEEYGFENGYLNHHDALLDGMNEAKEYGKDTVYVGTVEEITGKLEFDVQEILERFEEQLDGEYYQLEFEWDYASNEEAKQWLYEQLEPIADEFMKKFPIGNFLVNDIMEFDANKFWGNNHES
ncbi:MAG: hypothetical protein LBH89_02975 [Lactococcus lactis]|jgi:hypothetical protein|nr:hypothetical protein [Lactococcus lactis]